MNDLNNFVKEAKKDLKEILSCSGSILYSSADTLKQNGPVYLLGINPGGNPETHKDDTIEKSLDELPAKKDNNYLDDKDWNSDLQSRVCWLLENLGLETREVCASNLIFKRSQSKEDIEPKFNEYADICWPVHDKILKMVNPKLIIAVGNEWNNPENSYKSSYGYLRDKLGCNDEKVCDAGQSPTYKWKSFKSNSGIVVVGLPHLSWYAIDDNHSDVIDWIKQLHYYPL